jgi:amino acid adenylation domain-containing protein
VNNLQDAESYTTNSQPPCLPESRCDGGPVQLQVHTQLADALRDFAAQHQVTLLTVLVSGWTILVGRWSGQNDVILRARLESDEQTQADALDGRCGKVPTLQISIQDDLTVKQLLSQVPLACSVPSFLDAETERVWLVDAQTRTELSLWLSESGPVLGALLGCDGLEPETLDRMAAAWQVLLRGMLAGSEQPASRMPIVTAAEHTQVVHRFNDTFMDLPPDCLIHELFEAQALRTPDAIAVICEGTRVSFAELNARSNQLARYLRDRAVVPDQLVGLAVERDVEMVIGMLGVLKAGGAYVPLDPEYPVERLTYMLRDSAPRILLTQDRLRGSLPRVADHVVALDADWGAIAEYDDANIGAAEVGVKPRHLAYVIYTSGSTGEPKGAMNEHRGMVNRIYAQRCIEQFSDDDICCQKTSISFVDAVFETLGPLCNGLPLVIIPARAVADRRSLAALIAKERVTRLVTVPSLARVMADDPRVMRDLAGLRSWTLSGEEVPPDLLLNLHRLLPECTFINQYGSSEVSSDAACHRISACGGRRVPIGRPVPNARVYVLDRHGEPVPVGVIGEICVAGVGVGRGYLNRPELTTERFVSDRFGGQGCDRMYRTGDLGRWRADGLLECLGRIDRQVKIRGFRIELGEIETQVLSVKNVREAAVVVREDAPGDRRLVAYVTLRNEDRNIDTLRAHLKSSLPNYMIPAAIVVLHAMPLTPNGKLDRRSLPAPLLDAYSSRPYEAPRGEVERTLAEIWRELLRLDRVGRDDNFFELGGHSLLIVQMLERLRRAELHAEVGAVYTNGTLAELARTLMLEASQPLEIAPNLIPDGCLEIKPQMLPLVDLKPEHIEQIVQTVPGGAENIQDIYPLAPLQEGILFHHLLAEGGDTYVLPMLLRLPSRQALDEFVVALQKVMDRHDILRTAVLWQDLPQSVQVVYRRAILPVEELAPDEDRDTIVQLREKMKPDRQRIDLRKAPLMQLQLAAASDGQSWYALLQVHHLVCDNESLETMLAEVKALMEGFGDELPEPVAYRNHVAHVLEHARKYDAEAFFRQKLGDIQEPTIPFGVSDLHGDASGIEQARVPLDAALVASLRAQSRRLGVSAATLFHAAWALVVAHTSGRDDVVYGSVLLGRLQGSTGAQRALGMFINTLPLRLRLQDVTATELVENTQRELVELLNHEQASLAVAQRCSGLNSSAPLFTALLNYIHLVPPSMQRYQPAAQIDVLAVQSWTNYPIVLSVEDLGQGEGFVLQIDAGRGIDPFRLVGYTRTALQSLVDALETAPQASAARLSILPTSERHQILYGFNATYAPFPQERLVHELFEEQVARTPEAIAVVYEEQSLTYASLNRRANELARYLLAQGVQPGEYIPILMPRCLQMLIAQLAILKCGGAYVPIDPALPQERRAFMLRDCAARRVLAWHKQRPAEWEAPLQWIDCAELQGDPRHSPADDLRLRFASPPPAYVMYTSGSTGVPKGVVVPHRAVIRLVVNINYAPIEPDDCLAHSSNPAFDASTFEIWGALLNGARVLIVPPSVVLDAERFAQLLTRNRVSILWITVGLFTQYADSLAGVFGRLRYLITGGDVVEPGSVARVLRNSPPRHFLNAYGPTECTTFSTTYLVDSIESIANGIPIGRPISATQIYILDKYLEPVPLGVTGEIYIGGPRVALGYLNRPELTAERFLPDRFAADPEARMYKTGDLARWRADGNIEFLGRNDQQLKLRGFRIELGEIEARLLQHEHITQAAVIAREDTPGEKRLVAYLVPGEGCAREVMPNPEALRGYLASTLPEYMMPSAFVTLERLPLTVNGKLDRRALPSPDLTSYARRGYDAPLTEVEQILAGIWQELLRVDRVGRQDNFFELGGHSLLLVQMMERLRRAGLSTDIRSIYASQTLTDLARALTAESACEFRAPENLIPPECRAITPYMLPLVQLEPEHIYRIVQTVPGGARNIQDIYPLAPLQEGLLFHHLLDQQRGDTYVLATVLSVCSRARLDELVAALQAVIDRHDILRTAILWQQLPSPVQVVWRQARLPVTEVQLDPDRKVSDQINDWIDPERQRLDLGRAPLVRIQVARHPDSDEWYVLLQLHHIVCDHVTLEVVISEVVAHLDGQAAALAKSFAYRNHVAQALQYARVHDGEAFFREKLGDVTEPTAPFGLVDVRAAGSRIEESRREVDPALARRVRTHARRLGVSVATLFHAAWALVVSHTSGRDDVVYGTLLIGRLQGNAGAQNILGMFINTVPLRMRLQDLTAKGLVEQTQRELVELLVHEHTPLAAAQRCSGIPSTAPLFTALLNYRHTTPLADWSNARGIRVLADQERTNYPVTFSVDDLGEGFALTAQTDRSIDPRRVVGYMDTALRSLLEALDGAPQTPALALPVLSDSERKQVVQIFNATQAAYRRELLVHNLFEQAAKENPDTVAVLHNGNALSYAELNARANQVARCLKQHGVGPDQVVGICTERGLDMVVGLLAIAKAGGAYLPLDPNYPPERLQYMLEDSAPTVVLTQDKLRQKLRGARARAIALDVELCELEDFSAKDLPAAEIGLTPDNLVYLIYTSGSTGRPKATAMPHRAMVNLLEWHKAVLPASRAKRVLQFAALSFDVAFQETFSTLSAGATLVLLDEWIRRDARALGELLVAQSIERLFVPPLMLQSLAEALQNVDAIPASLKEVITAGEQLRISPEIVSLFARLPGCTLHNHYGPTETHVVTALTLSGDPAKWPALPAIGSPISNTQIHVLNPQHQPLPVGVAGELFIAGAGVAREYRGRPELTAQRFLRDPFSADPNARMYKTGDLGRWRADGVLEYLGRNDDQIKIRGYRIELGEIETQLAKHPHVRDAAVVLREEQPGEKRLVGYVTLHGGGSVSAEELREHLKAVVPDYMVPGAFVILESLPQTPSGKLDRRALPAPDLGAYVTRAYEAPKEEVEETLARIWQELLRVPRVGRQDDFFELGGHSLLATRVISRIRDLLHVEIPIKALFDATTLRQLAIRVRDEAEAQAERELLRMDGLARTAQQYIDEMHDEVVLARIAELERELTHGDSRPRGHDAAER